MKVENQKVVSFTITLTEDEARDLSHLIYEAHMNCSVYYSDWMGNLEKSIDEVLSIA